MLGLIRPPLVAVPNVYENRQHYQAIHSNLLLEDFLPALRTALLEMRRQPRPRILDDAWVYENVTLLSPTERMGNLIPCRLKTSRTDGRQPKFGHLLVFSRGSFDKDLFLGMVGSTDYDEAEDDGRSSEDDLAIEVKGIFSVCDHELEGEWDDNASCASDDNFDPDIYVEKETQVDKEGDDCIVKIKLLRDSKPDLTQLADGQYVMLETKIFFFMYYHILRVLNRFTDDTFPLNEVLLNCRQYIRNLGDNPALRVIFTPMFSGHMPNFVNWIREKAAELNMNASQVAALESTFNRKVSLIQGPPGTGKTFFGAGLVKVYLDLYESRDNPEVNGPPNPPFLIVCQTNHALDNFLNNVLRYTNRIVRVGGECKNVRVTPYCLTELVCRQVVLQLKRCPLHSDRHNRERNRYLCVQRLRDHLHELHICRHEVQDLRWQAEDNPRDAHASKERLTTFECRVRKLEKDIQKFYDQLPRIFRRIQGSGMTRRRMVLEILRETHIIGMTTTGAAIRSDILENNLKISLVVVEEAAAVLESHIVVSLTQHCRCLIMLGDHKQLQPILTNYKLEEYNFHISLFERLLKCGHPKSVLNPQYRMRPQMSKLLRGVPHFYKVFENGPGTKGRTVPYVWGLTRCVYFFTHNQMEHTGPRKRGYWNPFEVETLVKLAEFLVNNDCYSPLQIAIIAMYAEQTERLRQARDRSAILRGIEVATVDGFQGKEKDVILLSTVRSNEKGRIGFLSKPNRVCVALSRARLGLFMVGDMDCLTSRVNNNVWNTVQERLINQNALGPLPADLV